MKILQINSSSRREGANSTRIANSIVERLKARHADAAVTIRDLAANPHPILDEATLGVPMYNFGNSIQLKTWIDAIARAGVTFRYTPTGPEGLIKGKTVYVALARGGVYRNTPNDSQVPYLKSVLGFLGMTDVHFIYAEGLAMGPEAAEQGFAQAQADIDAALA